MRPRRETCPCALSRRQRRNPVVNHACLACPPLAVFSAAKKHDSMDFENREEKSSDHCSLLGLRQPGGAEAERTSPSNSWREKTVPNRRGAVLLDGTLGFINLAQNETINLLAVIFRPPTIVAAAHAAPPERRKRVAIDPSSYLATP